MKYFKFMSLFLGMMVATTAFVACGDDDDKPNNTPSGNQGGNSDDPTPPPVNDIKGTWRVEVYVSDEQKAQGNYQWAELQFNEDGTYRESWSQWNETRCEGTWAKDGDGKVKVKITKKFVSQWQNNNEYTMVEDPNFTTPVDTTFTYTFKDNSVLLAESYLLDGYMLYTRDGKVSTKGYGNYAGHALVGSWKTQEWRSWSSGWYTTEAEFTADGLCYDQTYDAPDESGDMWGEGFGGYYFIEGDQLLCIKIFGTLYNPQTQRWEFARPWLQGGGQWQKIDIRDNVLYTPVGHFSFANSGLRKVGTIGKGEVTGTWESLTPYYITNSTFVNEVEHWELNENKECRHWQTEYNQRNSKLIAAEGKAKKGTYTVDEAKGVISVTWTHYLDYNESTGTFTDGQAIESGSDEAIDYAYQYSDIADMLVIWWENAQYGTAFSRVKK